jgi:hypothetical protein
VNDRDAAEIRTPTSEWPIRVGNLQTTWHATVENRINIFEASLRDDYRRIEKLEEKINPPCDHDGFHQLSQVVNFQYLTEFCPSCGSSRKEICG